MINTTIYGKFAFQWYVGDEFTTLGFAPRQDVMWFIVDTLQEMEME